MQVRLFVGNLSYDVTESELREHFSAVGPVSQIFLPVDRETGKLRGFAFVEFDDGGQAAEAIKRLDGRMFKGRPLAINEARARESRPPGTASARPAPSGPQFVSRAAAPENEAREPKPGRSFGPDAAPRRSRGKPGRKQPKERGAAGPMRERSGGRFFGGEDDALDDTAGEENFASRVDDFEGEEQE
jgi:RNA recognition motif-containing protein